MGIREPHAGSMWWWKCLDCTDVSILVVKLYESFVRSYHWGNWVKDTQGLSIVSYN